MHLVDAAHKRSGNIPARKRVDVVLPILFALLVLSVLYSAGTGAMHISLETIISILGARLGLELPWPFTVQEEAVIWTIRFPRVMMGMVVGGSLALAGAVLQGLFRNPLADPTLLGISNGAAFGAALAITLGSVLMLGSSGIWQAYSVPLFAFAGGLVVTLVVYRLSTRSGITSSTNMLLAGIAMNAIMGAMIGFLVFVADDAQLRNITFWLLGSLGGAEWQSVLALGILVLPPALLLYRFSYTLDVMLLGEEEAGHLGINVQRVKILVVACSALLVGAATAVSGIIGFIGLVAPHIVRMIIGPKHTRLLPAVVLFGALLVIIADVVARTIVLPAELPIGILTSAIGGPFFLWLLLKNFHKRG